MAEINFDIEFTLTAQVGGTRRASVRSEKGYRLRSPFVETYTHALTHAWQISNSIPLSLVVRVFGGAHFAGRERATLGLKSIRLGSKLIYDGASH